MREIYQTILFRKVPFSDLPDQNRNGRSSTKGNLLRPQCVWFNVRKAAHLVYLTKTKSVGDLIMVGVYLQFLSDNDNCE